MGTSDDQVNAAATTSTQNMSGAFLPGWMFN